MAHLAGLAGRNVRAGLAHRRNAVMAIGTSAGDYTLMIEVGGFPGRRGVAGIAGQCRRYMRHRFGLSIDGRIGTVVASGAIPCRHRACGT